MIFINYIINLVEQYGIIIIIGTILIEYACFPLSSEIVLPLAGALCVTNNFNVFLMILLSVIAGNIGSLICYFIGRFANKKVIKFLSKKKTQLKESENNYSKFSSLSVCFSRLIPICRTYISFISGAKKQNIGSFIFLSTIGISIWNTILILLGYTFYNNIDVIAIWYQKYKFIILSFFSLLIIFFILKKIHKKKKIKYAEIN